MTTERAIELLEYVKHSDFGDGATGIALEMAIKALERQRWIPVSERLPEDGDIYPMCLVTIENGEVCLGVYRHCDKEWLTRMNQGENVYSNKHEVLAWQPLPESYKGE